MEHSVASCTGWFKSSISFANGNCVEVQFLTDGGVQVRNSRHQDGPALTFTRDEWASFLSGAKDGEFDLPLPQSSAIPGGTGHSAAILPAMDQNGTSGQEWFKSSLSAAGNCVEGRRTADGGMQVRNSRDSDGAVLSFTRDEWDAFTGGVRLGEFG